ncbi:MAG: chondroitinase-B domain-containing protein [Gammaproteobacteria bacterium]
MSDLGGQFKTILLATAMLVLTACGGSSSGGNPGGGVTPVNQTGSVTISGTLQRDETLTATVSDSNGTNGVTISYQWLRDGTAIASATSATWTAVQEDVGFALSVNATYTDADGFSENVTSAPTANIEDLPPTDSPGSVSISGVAEVGQTLSAMIVDANGVPTSNITYQWRRDGTSIASAAAASYTLVAADAGSTISVNAVYTDDDGFNEDVTSVPTATVTNPVPAGAGNFPRGTLGSVDSVPAINCDTVYTNAGTLADDATRTMAAGTTLCLADGTYGDFELDFGGAGSAAMPITIAAENPGAAVITGETSVRMSGSYAVLQGLVFKGGQNASSDFLQTRNGSGGDFCNNCRITEIAVIDLQSDSSGKWLNIYGVDNRIDHSWFAGKENTGALLTVNREIPSGGTAADIPISGTIIDHNYFGDRPPTDGKAYAEGSDNDYEAIRVGTSAGHAFDSNVVVEYNYFERIEGEAEVISNKAGNNRIAHNTIRDSYGSLTTRHGANATIEGNFIMGDGHPYAGGLRIIDDGHRVINNYIEGARYKNTRFHGGIVIHNGNGSTSNGYQNVFNVLIAHNTVVDSVNSLNVNGGNQSTNPENVFFVNNIIDDAIGPIITYADEGLPANSSYAGNYVFGQAFSDEASITAANGFADGDIAMTEDNLGISRPADAMSVAADSAANIGAFASVGDDLDGDTRSGDTQSGSDHIPTTTVTTGLLTSADVGPINYRPDFSRGYVGRVDVTNANFDATGGWDLSAPATFTTNASEVFSGTTAVVSGGGSLSQEVALDPNTTYTLTAFTKGPVQLNVTNGANTTTLDDDNSDYRLSTLRFDTTSSGNAVVSIALDSVIETSVAIADPSFDDFTGNASDPNWTVNESSGNTGQVQTTGNSATGTSGALKFRLNAGSGEVGGQGVTQDLTGIVPNTQYTLSAYVLYKRDRTDVTATIGVYEQGTTNVVASKVLDYQALEAAGAMESEEDNFLLDSFTFDSGSQTGLTLFVTYNVNDVLATTADQSEAQADSELWVDDISLTAPGAPDTNTFGYVDEVRIVSHGN